MKQGKGKILSFHQGSKYGEGWRLGKIWLGQEKGCRGGNFGKRGLPCAAERRKGREGPRA